MVGEVNFLLKLACYTCGVTILETVQYFLPLVLLFLSALLLTAFGLLCIVLLSCVYLCYFMCIVLLCVCVAVLHTSVARCWLGVSIRKVLQPAPRRRFFMVSLCLKANVELVPKTPRCYCMLLP